MSHVTCHMTHVMSNFFFLSRGQNGGDSQWRVCYQRGLRRISLEIKTLNFMYTFYAGTVYLFSESRITSETRYEKAKYKI